MCDAIVDALPAGRDEVDKEREVVDAGMPLGDDVSFDALEAAYDLVHEAAHLGEMPGAGAEVVADSFLDRVGEPGFELGRCRGERFDRGARPFERRVERCGVGSLVEALLGACDHVFIHGGDDTNWGGWTSTSSSTTCRRS